MVVNASGSISLSAVAAEHGDSAPHKITELYRINGIVSNTSKNSTVPTSGTIRATNFYNTVREYKIFNESSFSGPPGNYSYTRTYQLPINVIGTYFIVVRIGNIATAQATVTNNGDGTVGLSNTVGALSVSGKTITYTSFWNNTSYGFSGTFVFAGIYGYGAGTSLYNTTVLDSIKSGVTKTIPLTEDATYLIIVTQASTDELLVLARVVMVYESPGNSAQISYIRSGLQLGTTNFDGLPLTDVSLYPSTSVYMQIRYRITKI